MTRLQSVQNAAARLVSGAIVVAVVTVKVAAVVADLCCVGVR